MKKLLVIAVLAVALSAAPAAAREGFYAGGFFSVSSISGSSGDSFDQAYFDSLGSGLGGGLRLGAGFNEYVSLEGSYSVSYHDTDFLGLSNLQRQKLTGKAIALKVNFPLKESNVEPYFFAGVGAYEIGDSGGTYYKGSGKEFGAGLDLYVSPEVSLNAGLTFTSITFTKGQFHLNHDVDANVTALDIGVAFHFL